MIVTICQYGQHISRVFDFPLHFFNSHLPVLSVFLNCRTWNGAMSIEWTQKPKALLAICLIYRRLHMEPLRAECPAIAAMGILHNIARQTSLSCPPLHAKPATTLFEAFHDRSARIAVENHPFAPNGGPTGGKRLWRSCKACAYAGSGRRSKKPPPLSRQAEANTFTPMTKNFLAPAFPLRSPPPAFGWTPPACSKCDARSL